MPLVKRKETGAFLFRFLRFSNITYCYFFFPDQGNWRGWGYSRLCSMRPQEPNQNWNSLRCTSKREAKLCLSMINLWLKSLTTLLSLQYPHRKTYFFLLPRWNRNQDILRFTFLGCDVGPEIYYLRRILLHSPPSGHVRRGSLKKGGWGGVFSRMSKTNFGKGALGKLRQKPDFFHEQYAF